MTWERDLARDLWEQGLSVDEIERLVSLRVEETLRGNCSVRVPENAGRMATMGGRDAGTTDD